MGWHMKLVICVQLAYVSVCLTREMSVVREWTSLDVLTSEDGQESRRSIKLFEIKSWLLYKDRVFVTLLGQPYTLAYLDLTDNSPSPLLRPCPSYENQQKMIYLYKVRVDRCDRLWMISLSIDLYTIYMTVFDLKTNSILRNIPQFYSYDMTVDDFDCNNEYVYISTIKGVWTYSWAEDDSWRHKFSVPISSMILAPNSIVYFNGAGGHMVYYMSTTHLRDKSNKTSDIRQLGRSRKLNVGLYSSALDAKSDVLYYFNYHNRTVIHAVPCWTSERCSSNCQDVSIDPTHKLKYITVDENDYLWAITSRSHFENGEINFRLLSVPVKSTCVESNAEDTTNTSTDVESNAEDTTNTSTDVESNAEDTTNTSTDVESNAEDTTNTSTDVESNAEDTTNTSTDVESNAEDTTNTSTDVESNAEDTTNTSTDVESNAEDTTNTSTDVESNAEDTTNTITDVESNAEDTTNTSTDVESNAEDTTNTSTDVESNAEDTTNTSTDVESNAEDTTNTSTDVESNAENTTNTSIDVESNAEDTTNTSTDAESNAEDTTKTSTDVESNAEDTTKISTDVESNAEDTTNTSTDVESNAEDTTNTSTDVESNAEDTTNTSTDVESNVEDTTNTSTDVESNAEDTTNTSTDVESNAEDTTNTSTDVESNAEDTTDTSTDIEPNAKDTTDTANIHKITTAATSTTEQISTLGSVPKYTTVNIAAGTPNRNITQAVGGTNMPYLLFSFTNTTIFNFNLSNFTIRY